MSGPRVLGIDTESHRWFNGSMALPLDQQTTNQEDETTMPPTRTIHPIRTVTLRFYTDDPAQTDPLGRICIDITENRETNAPASVGLSKFTTWDDVMQLPEGPQRTAAAMAWAFYAVHA